jgi:hypothetical protein
MKFEPGTIVATPAALDALKQHGQLGQTFLDRHFNGDWGDLCDEDKLANDQALLNDCRLLSSYNLTESRVGSFTKIWIISECDRSATTILLPCEY